MADIPPLQLLVRPFPAAIFSKIFTHLPLVLSRFLSGNYFDCGNSSDYGTLATYSDFETWDVQCGACPITSPPLISSSILSRLLFFNPEQSCPLSVQPNVTFFPTQGPFGYGECESDFEGTPRRKCLRLGIQRIWDSNTEGSCKREFLTFALVLVAFTTFFFFFFLSKPDLPWSR